jgi:hypothetical protein
MKLYDFGRQTSLRAVLEAYHVQDALRRLPLESKIGSEPSEKSSFQAFHPGVDQHKLRCHGEGGVSEPRRDLPRRSLNLDEYQGSALIEALGEVNVCAQGRLEQKLQLVECGRRKARSSR